MSIHSNEYRPEPEVDTPYVPTEGDWEEASGYFDDMAGNQEAGEGAYDPFDDPDASSWEDDQYEMEYLGVDIEDDQPEWME